jgi:TolA-binding protein
MWKIPNLSTSPEQPRVPCGLSRASNRPVDRKRQTRWRGLLWILCITLLSPDLAAADKATDDFNLGLGFYRGKRWEQSEETLGQFLQEFPEHPRANIARLYYARTLSVREKYQQARLEFQKFIQSNPDGKDLADARYRLGECSYFLKDYPAAVEQLSAYRQEHPGHTLSNWATLLLGDSHVALKKYQEAIDILMPLSEDQTNASILADARFSLGKAMEGLNRVPEALVFYKAVVSEKNATPAPRALNRIATIQFLAASYSDAASSFEQLATEYSATSLAASATLGAGMSWYRAGEYEKALVWLRKVPSDSAAAAQAIMMTAMSLKELGQIEESRQVFADALKAAGDKPLAADILFQQAQMERTLGSKEVAVGLFEDICDRWPESRNHAECLFNAAEVRLELSQRENAERLWNRLKADFPTAAARPREQILLGRIFLSRGDLTKAIETLRNANAELQDPQDRVSAVGQYYLVRALYEAKEFEAVVVQTSAMSDLFKIDELSEVRGALALAAMSSLQLKKYEQALKFADEFLPVAVDPRQKQDVTAARAVALSHLKRFEDAVKDLTTLTQTGPDEPQTWTAVLQSAEAALEHNSPDDATTFFKLAAAFEKDPAVKEAGLTGIAWSQFKAKKYAEAESSFAKIVEQYSASEDAAQTLFMWARSVEEQGDIKRIATVYKEVFDKLTKDQPPAAVGDELVPPLQYAFDAGRQAARSLEKGKRIDEADQLWESLVQQFPHAKDLDRILDEWAWLNVTAERYEKSDSIHRQLVERFPDSPFAGQARLSLAESLLESGKLEEALAEMNAITGDERYGATEKERALFHVVEIQAALRKWPALIAAADQFQTSFPTSPLAPQVRLFAGNANVELQKPDEAIRILSSLHDEIVAGKIPVQDWTDRVWIVLGEAALASKNYEQIDALEAELKQRNAKSAFAFQMMDIQGRRWKQQAPPDFAKARLYFYQVTADADGQGTETAARCQFLAAETLLLEMKLDEAVKEYFKVYLNYSYDELRAQALFQAASCEAKLQKTDAAMRDFKELIATFPTSPLVEKSAEEIRKLELISQ